MDLNRLTREADEQIRKVVARYNQLYVPTGTVSQVELDLLLDELRKLYDTFKTIGHLNQERQHYSKKPEVTVLPPAAAEIQPAPASAPTPPTAAIPKPEPEAPLTQTYTQPQAQPQKQPEPQASQPQPESQPEPKPEPSEIYTAPQTYVREVEPEVKYQAEPVADSTPEKQPADEPEVIARQHTYQPQAVKPVTEFHPDHAPTMLADRFNQGNKSLSETIAHAPANESAASRVVFQPITDLSAGIGINDRFTFVSELFDNNTGQYMEAITRINKAVNIDEANWIFQKYHTSAWNQKQETVARMKDFIKRRFI